MIRSQWTNFLWSYQAQSSAYSQTHCTSSYSLPFMSATRLRGSSTMNAITRHCTCLRVRVQVVKEWRLLWVGRWSLLGGWYFGVWPFDDLLPVQLAIHYLNLTIIIQNHQNHRCINNHHNPSLYLPYFPYICVILFDGHYPRRAHPCESITNLNLLQSSRRGHNSKQEVIRRHQARKQASLRDHQPQFGRSSTHLLGRSQ